jgi:NADH-quinone oxidoreductase subunit G
LTARDDTERVYAALADPGITTVVQVAPAVRSAWAESLGLDMDKTSPGKMAAALRRIGFDYVFDTDFGADVTIMEEGMEFIERVIKTNEPAGLPMFTSCCPGWVRFLKSRYPDMVECLSSAKSPQQIFGAVAKTWFAGLRKIDPAKMFVVSVMPCVAKKHECALPGMDSTGAGSDVDVVLTTREFTRMLRSDHVNVKDLPDEPFDMPLGDASGAGVIFGATGGVMEAALRTVYCVVTGKKPPTADAFRKVRGMEGWKSAEFDIEGRAVRVAVASGLGNATALVEAIRKGEAQYDFVEVMACPGGCAGGGGQPIAPGREPAMERGERLFNLDAQAPVRYSHENAAVIRLYGEYLEKPLSHRAHELLHYDHHTWTMPHR